MWGEFSNDNEEDIELIDWLRIDWEDIELWYWNSCKRDIQQ